MMDSAKRKSLIFTAVIAAIAVMFAVLSNVAVAAPDETDNKEHAGYIPVEKDVYKVPSSKKLRKKSSGTALPSYYRSDKQLWAEGIKVKNQNPTGLCWAFSTTTAAEYSYAKEMNEGKSAGEITPVKEMSPGHLGYFLYNRVNDPCGNTGNDFNTIISSESWADTGGNELFAMQHLATWSGVGEENDTPFALVRNGMASIGNGSFDGYKDDQAYKNYVTQEESIYLDSPSINKIKEMIKEHGAVSISLAYYREYLIPSEHAFYNKDDLVPEVNEINHAVTAIGWDDNFSKDNFSNNNFKNAPGSDGALIIQNSWGNSWLGGEDAGLIYVSYESKDILNSDVFAFDMQPADTYEHNFQYDGTADCCDTTDEGNEEFQTVKGTKAANVYINNTGKAIELEAVGFTTFNYGNSDYQIDVYKDVDNTSDPTSGIHAGTTNVSTTTPGCKTAVLKEPVTLGSGERYSIVFSFAGKNAFGVEQSREYKKFGWSFEAGTDPGQSFFKAADSDAWKDMKDYGACFRIKGFANDIKYTVQFADGLGNIISTQKVLMGQSAVAPADPKRKGYEFIGWDKKYSAVYGDILVTAQWKKIKEPKPSVKKKAANTLTLKGKTVKVRYKKLRKRAQKIKRSKMITVKNAKGKLTYKIAVVKRAKYKKYFKINKATGKLKIKKRLRKGIYKVKVKVNAAGNKYYKPAAKMVTFKVRVK